MTACQAGEGDGEEVVGGGGGGGRGAVATLRGVPAISFCDPEEETHQLYLHVHVLHMYMNTHRVWNTSV